jgi:nucleoid DNA-binding protein
MHQADANPIQTTARAAGFNKREFSKLVAARFGVTQEEGALFFDEIGQRMGEGLAAGETVFLFGQGTLKVVKSRGVTEDVRIRFRPTTRAEKNPALVIEGLPGIAAGVIKDVLPIGSVSAGDRALQVDRACVAEGAGGKIVIYKDDQGRYRGVLTAPGAAPAESIMVTKKAAKAWLREAFPLTR